MNAYHRSGWLARALASPRRKLGLLPLTLLITGIALVAAAPAKAGPGFAGSDVTVHAQNHYTYRGWAWDLYPSWTYSFRLRFIADGVTANQHIWENRSGSTSFGPSSHTISFTYPVNDSACADMRVYHSSTVGNNLVDSHTECVYWPSTLF